MNDDDPAALARLLGVDPDLDPDRLRAAYDEQMSRATRSGDHRRALALSQAYDALPGRTRSSVYSGGRTYATILPPGPPARRTARRSAKRGRPVRRRRFSWKGLLGYGVVVPAIVLLVGWSIYRQNSGPDYAAPPDDRAPAVVQQPAATLRIPADAPVAANGLAKVRCDGESTYVMTAPRGATVSCGNGATPVVVSP